VEKQQVFPHEAEIFLIVQYTEFILFTCSPYKNLY